MPQHIQTHVIDCSEETVAGERPVGKECAILARKVFQSLPNSPVMWRLETFPTQDAARQAQTEASVVVRAAGEIWLLSLGTRGERSRGGKFVAEVGPLPIPTVPRYELLVAEADVGPDAMNRAHTHSGPEAWYILRGEQCVHTPNGMVRARAGEGLFVPADTPMRLTFPVKRDAFFIVVHDPARAWNTFVDWEPKELCH